MPRPPSTDPTATEVIRFRVKPEDKVELVRMASDMGMSLSAYLIMRGLSG